MFFQNLARKNEIGANCYLIETHDSRIILDSGMHPKEEGLDALPAHHLLKANSIDAVVLSHAHLDHTGTIPVILRDQEDAPLYLTQATADLAKALLHNSVNVMQSKRMELGITEYPLYGHRELDRLATRWKPQNYEQPWKINRDTKLTLYDAGHILGSSGVMIESDNKRIFYTGDIQFEDQTLITGAKFPTEKIDTLIVETTRGAVPRAENYSRDNEENKLCEAIVASLEGGGSALIPVFAMGKTQEVMTMIHKFKLDGRIPAKTPVYMGGLSTKMTKIFDDLSESTSRRFTDFKILEDMEIITGSKKHKGAPITYRPGAIFCLSSGMMSEHTTSNLFAQSFISNPKNSLLFVGYCDPQTPGGIIRKTNQGETIRLSKENPPVTLNCAVEVFDFSGHSTREAILEYIVKVKPKQILLVHGDLAASQWFEKQIKQKLPHSSCVIPTPGEKLPL